MGRKSRLKAKRRQSNDRGRRFRDVVPAEVLAELDEGERVVAEALRLIRGHGVTGLRAFRMLTWFLYVRAEGLTDEDFEAERFPPERLAPLLQWTKVAVLRVVSLADSIHSRVDPHVRADAAWMLATVNVAPADFGMERRPSPSAGFDLLANMQATMERVDVFAVSLWDDVLVPEDHAALEAPQLTAPNVSVCS